MQRPVIRVTGKTFLSMKKTKEGGKLNSLSPKYKPKSENQSNYLSALKDSKIPIVLGIGPAGCGKTLFACITAIDELRSGTIQKIILTRPIVPVEEEELGFLPGNLVHKMDPWTRPIFDIFLEFYQQRELDAMIMTGVIEISPLAYMRGRTFKRSFIIADEMQNSTPNQMLMLATRIGLGSKMVITGDLKQSDRSEKNGLLDLMTRLKVVRSSPVVGIHMVEMTAKDIERSPIVSTVLELYNPLTTKESSSSVAVDSSSSITVIEDAWALADSYRNSTVVKPVPITPVVMDVNKTKPFDLLAATRRSDAALIPREDLPTSEKKG